eukprot:32553-Rhodomonas_salina.2
MFRPASFQNAYSPYDPCCPFYKSVWMLKCIVSFYNLVSAPTCFVLLPSVAVPHCCHARGGGTKTPLGVRY